jgi:hypothetical protein
MTDAETERLLAEDKRLLGNCFWVRVNGRKVRVDPAHVFMDTETQAYMIDPREALHYSRVEHG